ncbi:MAG TPA: YhfC family glutamic-type intramembrane protease [Anaerolineales bacterium]
MLIVAYMLSITGMIVLPILLAFYLTRKFKLSWKLVLAGALTFIAAQVLHIPVVYGLTALFNNGTLPAIPEAWRTIFNAILLGLLAGIFEETARLILFKFRLKDVKTWEEGVLVGTGHGGVEAFILGLLGILTLVNMVIMRTADLSALGIPAEQIEVTRQQVDSFWNMPFYMALLGVIERVFAICLHLSLSVMVLYSVVYKKPAWFWLALLWHAFVDAVAVYLLPLVGALAIEGIIGVLAGISLLILFGLRPKFVDQEPIQQAVRV